MPLHVRHEQHGSPLIIKQTMSIDQSNVPVSRQLDQLCLNLPLGHQGIQLDMASCVYLALRKKTHVLRRLQLDTTL